MTMASADLLVLRVPMVVQVLQAQPVLTVHPVLRSSCSGIKATRDHRVSLGLLVLPAPMVLLVLPVVLARPSFSWVKMVSTG